VTSHSGHRQKHGRKRREKSNHQPAHGIERGSLRLA
jgi:hypothetical protein